MTGPSTTPIPVVGASSGEPTTAVASGGEVLHRAEGLELLGEVPGSGYRQAPAPGPPGAGPGRTTPPPRHPTRAASRGRRGLTPGAPTGRRTSRPVVPAPDAPP